MSNKKEITKMFDSIAPKYDFLNHFFSFGIDIYWRKKAVKQLKSPKYILDIATGTGDLAIELAKLKPKKIVGIDLSKNMLKRGREKIKKRNLLNIITLKKGDTEKLDFKNNSFDAVTIAFGIRNVQKKEKALKEIHRVLRTGGQLIILEFSSDFLLKKLFHWYYYIVIPFIGKIISNSKSAYAYLPKSINRFPSRKKFAVMVKNAGFEKVQRKDLTFGMVTIYNCKKEKCN